MRKTKRNRGLLITGAAATALALMTSPNAADAKSRRQFDKPDAVQPGDGVATLNTGDGRGVAEAPEIDPNALGQGIALAAGGLAVLTSRRRSRKPKAR